MGKQKRCRMEKNTRRDASVEEGRTIVMTDKIIENNQVSIMGKIISGFTFSHEVFGEGFYMMDVSVQRLSDSSDVVPVMVSERLIDVTQDYDGEYIQIYGQFRSYNRHEEKKNRLVLSVFAREVNFVEEEGDKVKSNQIPRRLHLQDAVYRRTPLEEKWIWLAVNRPYGKSTTFRIAKKKCEIYRRVEVGGHVQVWGRIQSREYVKKLDEETTEKRIAYEVSVSKLELIE
ncbi:MAG: single-stranded DNA-binding protein [Lachnospiraceae bacterium]